MNGNDTTYRISNVVYDVNLCNQAKKSYTGRIPPEELADRIKFTATVLDDQDKPPDKPLPVYWNCPRPVVQFSDKGGNITTQSVTDPETGEAVIYASSPALALARIGASLTPSIDVGRQFLKHVVFCTIAPDDDWGFDPPIGISLVTIPAVYQNVSTAYSYHFEVSPSMAGKDYGIVAAWAAQIDYPTNTVLEKTLLFPTDHLSGDKGPLPASWRDLYTRGIDVPYQIMQPNPHPSNIVQYLYQTDWDGVATPSTWFAYAAVGSAWVQPDPNRVESPRYHRPLLYNPNTGLEESNPSAGFITNDYFQHDSTGDTYWLEFHIHTDCLTPGDKISPYVYANGFEYGTDQRKSLHFVNGAYTVSEKKDVIQVLVPYSPLITIAQGLDTKFGHLDITYLVNQLEWSPDFSAYTAFDPGGLQA